MYAIVEIKKEQCRVEPGDIISVAKLSDAKRKVSFDKVLLISDKNITIGRPYIKGAKVTASVLRQEKAKKVIAFKYRRRKGYHRKVGHRQQLTRLKIEEIKL